MQPAVTRLLIAVTYAGKSVVRTYNEIGKNLMLELLREDALGPRFRRLRDRRAQSVIAVPYWGKGAVKGLGLARAQSVRIICNLDSDGCNPYVVAGGLSR